MWARAHHARFELTAAIVKIGSEGLPDPLQGSRHEATWVSALSARLELDVATEDTGDDCGVFLLVAPGATKGGAIDPELGRLAPDAGDPVPAVRRAGVADFPAHDLRRTFIGEVLEANEDPAAVRQQSGHRSTTACCLSRPWPEAARRQAAWCVRIPYVSPG